MAETVATYTVPEHHVDMYTSNVKAMLNLKGGKLRPTVSSSNYSGEKVQVVNFIGPIEFVRRDTPYQDTIVTEPEHLQRWISADDYDTAILIDRIDTLRMIYDPTSPYVERMREAAARLEDKVIMDAFFAAAMTGKRGATSVTFPNQDIIPNGGTGLTIAKLRATRKLLKKRLVDIEVERPKIGVTADEIDSLLGETQVQSADYNSIKPLVDGEVTRFMGFDFIPLEQIIPTTTGGTIRQLPVWVMSGMAFGDWQSLQIIINNRPDKNNIKQIHGSMSLGATRLEEGKVLDLEVLIP